MNASCAACRGQRPLCDCNGNLVKISCPTLPPCSQLTKLGYDADQMPLALRPRCPCCGCRQNPLHEYKISEVKRDGCAFDPCSPCDNRLYECYYEAFACSATNCTTASCCASQPDCPTPCPEEEVQVPCCPDSIPSSTSSSDPSVRCCSSRSRRGNCCC